MSHLLFWPTVVFFYPVGNTSAVCLTESLAPETRADVLLLACGDPRHILYTIYANETNPLTRLRAFDITCCDVDVAILARNALLFTILADDGALDKLDKLWDLFYHMFVDQTTLSILFEQCRKLVALAENLETWRAGPYGHFLTACDAATLAGLRRIWTTYLDTATFSSTQAKQFGRRFTDGMKETSQRRGSGTTTAARSAGPLSFHVSQAVSRQFTSYWSSGTTDAQGQGQKRGLIVNPTFAFSLEGDKFSVHYGTDPLCGFHLAEAFALSKSTSIHKCISPHEVVQVAREQFSRWCTSASKRLKDRNSSSPALVIRMFTGDVLTFCQALKYCEVTRSPVTPYNVAAWRLSTITLDGHYYGRNAVSPAPLSFNVIDTSNILDHAGLVNLLVVTAPLLRKISSATLYTEALLRKGGEATQAIHEHVCGDLPIMALLLGIIPSPFISQFTTRSNVHENFTMSENATQYHERLAWKVIGFGGTKARHCSDDLPAKPQRLFIPPNDLASVLFRIYLQMFSNEDMKSRFQQLFSDPPAHTLQTFRHSGILHYNRRSFALLVHFVKTRIHTDWSRTMELFEGMVMSDSRLLTGQQAYQELCCHLHLLGVYTTEWLSVPALARHRVEFDVGKGPLRVWTQTRIPQVVTLVLVVPREAIARLEDDFMKVGTPVMQCQMDDGPRQNWFAVTLATFGSLRVSGTGENRTAVIVEGCKDTGVGVDAGAGAHTTTMKPPWRTGAPLIIAFSVPSSSVMDFGRNPMATVGLGLRATPPVSAKFMDRLGFELMVFRTKLTDAERVFLLAQAPAVSASTSVGWGAGVGASAAMGDHWQENMKVPNSPDMPQETSEDIHVQMNDTASAIQSFSMRIVITDPGAKATLANKQTVPIVNSNSGSAQTLDACMRIGTHTVALQFPLPVDVARVKLRVARRSSYVEVVAPLTSFDVQPERDLSTRFTPLFWDPVDDDTPTLGSIHYLNLDRCPTFKLSKGPSESDWCKLHLNLMFSELEKKRARTGQTELPIADSSTSISTPDTLLRVKQTLHILLESALDATADGGIPGKVFALCDTSARHGPGLALWYLYIVIARMRLDVGSHTVVADTFVAASTPAVQSALDTASQLRRQGSRKPDDVAIQYIKTDADETVAWFHLLPCLTERCRTWPHRTDCAYRTRRQQEQKSGEQTPRTWRDEGPLCACGAGVGTEILPKAFEGAAQYLTRAAFSPLFSVPYLKEMDVPAVSAGDSLHGADAVTAGRRCRSCGKEGGLVCSQCKRVRYCSKECQRADWKAHKKDCRSGVGG